MESYSIEDRIYIIKEHYKNGERVVSTFRAIRNRFGRHKRPTETTIARLVRKFETTGSVGDLPATTRTKSVRTQENIDAVRESVRTEPTLSIAVRSQKLGIPQSSMRRIMQNDLNLRAVTITNMEEIGGGNSNNGQNHQNDNDNDGEMVAAEFE